MKNIFLMLGFAILVLSACNKVENPELNWSDKTVDPDLISPPEPVIGSINQFGCDIFRILNAEENEEKNLFISPTSISLALAMTLNGANEATEDSMEYALRVDHLTSEEINETNHELIEQLTTCDTGVLLSIANSIWYRLGFPTEQDFLDMNTEYYDAQIEEVDFSDPGTVDIINGWVAEETHDRIARVIYQIPGDAIMFLINAIYFKAAWSVSFDEELTHEDDFYRNDGNKKKVDLMSSQRIAGYFENELLQICELDYGDGKFSMIILLPAENVELNLLIGALDPENWNGWISSLSSEIVNLELPKFTFKYEKRLNSALSDMGMDIVFTPMADFTGINPGGGLMIDYVDHFTFVEVKESGTEAAAVTVVGMVTSVNIPQEEPEIKEMKVNRPFVFVIREKTTNAIVFLGKVADPVIESQ